MSAAVLQQAMNMLLGSEAKAMSPPPRPRGPWSMFVGALVLYINGLSTIWGSPEYTQ